MPKTRVSPILWLWRLVILNLTANTYTKETSICHVFCLMDQAITRPISPRGRGTFGKVVRCKSNPSKEKVAVKMTGRDKVNFIYKQLSCLAFVFTLWSTWGFIFPLKLEIRSGKMHNRCWWLRMTSSASMMHILTSGQAISCLKMIDFCMACSISMLYPASLTQIFSLRATEALKGWGQWCGLNLCLGIPVPGQTNATDYQYKKAKSRLHMLRRLKSFGLCRTQVKIC